MSYRHLFKRILKQVQSDPLERVLLFEHEILKKIPGTSMYYTIHKGNISTKTLSHCHIFASKGNSKQIYSINIDGTRHDNIQKKNIIIPSPIANHLRNIGFNISSNNIVEVMSINNLFESSNDTDYTEYRIIIFDNN